MRIDGQWVGIGLGDSSAEIRTIKTFMRRKFSSYAGHLADTEDYDTEMTAAVAEMQRRYEAGGKIGRYDYLPGIINVATKIVMGYLNPPPVAPPERPILFTVCGTGVPWWGPGPDSDLARAVEHKWRWQPIGYPAAPFPMNRSAQAGREELVNQITLNRRVIEDRDLEIALAGFSQGAIVTSECYLLDIVPPNGRLHWVKDRLTRAVTWGNPMRQQGSAWPDPGAAMVGEKSHGIADILMTDTPVKIWRDYAHKGDLYTDVYGESGENKRAIYKIVMGTRIFTGPDSILAQLLEVMGIREDAGQIAEVIGMFQAIMDAGLFFARGTGPHLSYHIGPAIDYLNQP